MLITYYLKKDRQAGPESNQTIDYVNAIIATDPNCLIAHYGKAAKYFDNEKYDEAFAAYLKCTEIKSDYFDAWFQCGLCKFRQGLELNDKINTLKSEAEKKATKESAKALFGEAIPFFEKAREYGPEEQGRWAPLLRDCYSAVDQKEKAEEMNKLF